MSKLTVVVKSMSSLEIAELTGKDHAKVLIDIRKMLDELGILTSDFSTVRKLCYIVSNIGARVMNRLKEPSSYAGLALIFNGISDCMMGNYQSGVPSIILGLVAVLKKENGAK